MLTAGTEDLVDRTLEAADLARRESLDGLLRSLSEVAGTASLVVVLAEVLSNAARHGATRRLRVRARRRGPLAMLLFEHAPPLPAAAATALARARAGWLPDAEALAPGGFGLPLLCRLARRLTLSSDRVRLAVWLATPR
jgi:anti-sigma regulatory factor (Ser/Thr protein kinase)